MIAAIIKLGAVVQIIFLMWSNKLTSPTAAAKFVVSYNGDILSPKYAPEITAPAVISIGMFRGTLIPINATPIVAQVDQELPILIETKAQTTKAQVKNHCGLIIWIP